MNQSSHGLSSHFPVFICCPLHPVFFELIKNQFGVSLCSPVTPTSYSHAHDAWALVVRSESKIDSVVLAALPYLRIVIRAGSGIDNIDMVEAERKGISIRNIPGQSSRDVAELALGLCLAIARTIIPAHIHTQTGGLDKVRFMGTRLQGAKLGIIGYGRIGRELGRLAIALGMNVTCTMQKTTHCDRVSLSARGIEVVDLDTILSISDFIVICLPLTDSTRGLINRRKLTQTKSGCYLVNVARAEVVDEEAVVTLLEQGHFAGVAFDTYGPYLTTYQHPLLLKTPHIGAMTNEAQQNIAKEVLSILLKESQKEILAN